MINNRNNLAILVFLAMALLGTACDQVAQVPTPPTPGTPSPTDPANAIYVRAGASNGNGTASSPYGTIGEAVRKAKAGDTILVAAGTYRETVRIDKRLTLIGDPGATIKGSEVWEGWVREGSYWTKPYNPTFYRPLRGVCRSSSNSRCLYPDQVFIDGQPQFQETSLEQVGPGDFYVGNGKIYLGSDPLGRTVEVTMRYRWLEGTAGASDVVIKGFTFRHAAVEVQHGGIYDGGGPRWRIEGNDIAYAHGAGVETDGPGTQVLNNLIHHNGQIGLVGQGENLVIRGNKVYQNNTEDFEPGWEAGGSKWALVKNLLVENNESYQNDGPGFWCDVYCNGVTFRGNRLHHNTGPGILFEISRSCTMENNQAWENGFGFPNWGWGAGLVVQNSSGCTVRGNVVAWNADGISVVQQDRDDYTEVTGNRVENNTIAVKATGQLSLVMAWLSDISNKTLYTNGTNSGDQNRFYREPTVSTQSVTYRAQLAWITEMDSLAQFKATPGGGPNSRDLDRNELNGILSAAGVPLVPERTTVR